MGDRGSEPISAEGRATGLVLEQITVPAPGSLCMLKAIREMGICLPDLLRALPSWSVQLPALPAHPRNALASSGPWAPGWSCGPRGTPPWAQRAGVRLWEVGALRAGRLQGVRGAWVQSAS